MTAYFNNLDEMILSPLFDKKLCEKEFKKFLDGYSDHCTNSNVADIIQNYCLLDKAEAIYSFDNHFQVGGGHGSSKDMGQFNIIVPLFEKFHR